MPNSSAHPKTVPPAELRYGTEEDTAEKVRAAAGGECDSRLPRLQRHAERFSEEAFRRRMLALGPVGASAGSGGKTRPRSAPAVTRGGHGARSSSTRGITTSYMAEATTSFPLPLM